MEASSYSEEDQIEAVHWWFKGRRWLFARILRDCGVPKDGRILDVGTASGSNLRMLRDSGYSNFCGLEISERAIEICSRKGLGPIERGDVCNVPFAAATFDFVLATDIIEHVERDDVALREIQRVLKPGAYCLITVPAFSSLWGHQDVKSHHKRRYRLDSLLARVKESGLQPVTSYYFNYLLFLPIWVFRRLTNRLPRQRRSETQINTPGLNRLLYWIFSLDVRSAPLVRPPFGVSALVLCRSSGHTGR